MTNIDIIDLLLVTGGVADQRDPFPMLQGQVGPSIIEQVFKPTWLYPSGKQATPVLDHINGPRWPVSKAKERR